MNSSQLLEGKRAVVFGAGGSVGSAVAKEFAAEGAEVFLAGRTQAPLDEVAKHIKEAGGIAHAAIVDALDIAAVDRYIDDIERKSGEIDIEFTAVGPRVTEFGNGKLAVDLTIDEFMVPVNSMLKAQFIAARSVARHMIKRKSGVIIFLTGSNARGHNNGASAIGTAFGAIETFMENFAYEISPHGVRAVCLRTTANVDTRAIQETLGPMAAQMKITKEELVAMIANANFKKVPAKTSDTAKLAVLLASDRVRMITGTVVNSTAGAGLD
jgi:3-oxoacyl-[acyl-carrier protein] reductase